MPTLRVIKSLESVRSVLERKGFDELGVTHYNDTPNGFVVLHDHHGQVARADHDELARTVEDSDDTDGLWAALDQAGLTRKAEVASS